MNLIDNNLKTGLIIGVVSSAIFVYLLDPILSITVKTLFNFGNYFSDIYFNWFFNIISQGKTDYAFLTLYMITSITLGSTMVYPIISFLHRHASERDNNRVPFVSSPHLNNIRLVAPILMMVAWSCIIANEYVKLRVFQNFEQRLSIITPHISDEKHKEILAAFASMRTKEDYKILSAQIDSVTYEKKIKAPIAYLKFSDE